MKFLIFFVFLFGTISSFSEFNSNNSPDFVLSEKPKYEAFVVGRRSIAMDVTLSSPISEHDIPEFYVSLYDKGKRVLMTIELSDEVCKGEYDAYLAYFRTKRDFEMLEFKEKIQWPETFSIQIVAGRSSFFRHRYRIFLGDEIIDISIPEKPAYYGLSVNNGVAEIEGLEVFE